MHVGGSFHVTINMMKFCFFLPKTPKKLLILLKLLTDDMPMGT